MRNNKTVVKQIEKNLYIAKLYDNKGLKNNNLGKSKNIKELKNLLRDFLFEKRKNRETNYRNNTFYIKDRIELQNYYTGKVVLSITVGSLLSTYGEDFWKNFD